MPIRDANLMLRNFSDGTIEGTATETLTLETVKGTPLTGMALQVNLGAITGTPGLYVDVFAGTATAPTTDFQIGASPLLSAAGEYFVPFTADYVLQPVIRVLLTGITATSDWFATCEVALVENVGRAWKR